MTIERTRTTRTNKNNVLRKLTRKWSGRLHDYVRRNVRFGNFARGKIECPSLPLYDSLIKEWEWRRKGVKEKERRGGSESIGTRISAGRSGKGRRGTVPWRGLNLRYDTHEAKSRRAAQSRLRLADEKSAPTSRDQLSARLRAERLYARTQPGTRIYDIVRRISQINFVFSRYLSLFRRCLFSERVKRISDLWQVTRNRISGDYRRDCQSSFQCGLLLWISHFAFSSKEFRVGQGASCRLTVSRTILFFYLYTFLRISPETAIVSLCG